MTVVPGTEVVGTRKPTCRGRGVSRLHEGGVEMTGKQAGRKCTALGHRVGGLVAEAGLWLRN